MKTLRSFFQLIFFSALTIVGVLLVLYYFDLTDFPGIIQDLRQELKQKEANLTLPDLNLTGLDLPGDKTIHVSVEDKGAVVQTNPLDDRPLPIVPTLVMPTPEPTLTPLPPMDPVEYQAEVTVRLKRYAAALESWLQTNDKLMKDNSLLQNANWLAEAKGDLAEIASAGQSLAAIDPPPAEYSGIDGWLKKIGPESEALQASYLKALETADPKDFTTAGDSFTRIKDYLTQAAQQMILAGWKINE